MASLKNGVNLRLRPSFHMLYRSLCPQIILMVIVAIAMLPCSADEPAVNQPPHVVVILTDDQGWGDLSLTGNQNIATPHLDRLARTGARFENFYVQPVCSPTRAEFLTGRYYPRGGVYSTGAGGERLAPDIPTIADVFKAAGYSTGAFGKWHNGTQAPYHPLTRGFDEFYGFTSGHWGSYFSPLLDHNGQLTRGDGYLPDDLTNRAIEFIGRNKDSNTPGFTLLALPTPHSPMQTTEAAWARFSNHGLPSRHDGGEPENLDHTRAALAMVENIDTNVGRLLRHLDSSDLAENTIVLFFSDNGPNGWRWNDGLRGRKGSTDEGGVRSPLFIRWPGHVAPDQSIDRLTAVVDLLPTLVELTGIENTDTPDLDGISAADHLLADASAPKIAPPARTLVSYWADQFSARNGQFRLDAEGRLHDLLEDRGQTRDVRHEYPDIARELRREILRYRSEVIPVDLRRARPFTVGFPGLAITQLPARDATWRGGITRSNQWPNCSYLTGWTAPTDEIDWWVEIGQSGIYEVTVYYTANPAAIGTELNLDAADSFTHAPIIESHSPPAYGMEYDRVPREESYVKDFKPLNLGRIYLSKRTEMLRLTAFDIPPGAELEFRLLTLKRVE